MYSSKFIISAFLILLVLPAFLAEELPLHRRTARSVGGFFKRIFGRGKQGFQGTANVPANTLYNAQQSSYFPNYASFLTQPSEQLNTAASFADYQNSQLSPYSMVSNGYQPSNLQSNYGGQGILSSNSNQEANLNSQPSDLSSFASNYGNLAASPNTQYANYAALPSNQMSSIASNPQNVDFNKVLDNFVRSAGLSPNGDHETAASNTNEHKDSTPVFSFKKLYSFPFYLNSEQNSNEGTYFNIPYMRKHIKRVSSDSNNQQVQPQATSSAASALMNYFGGKKLSDITKFYNHNQKYLQNVPAALNTSFYNPIYGNQLKKMAYYQAQQFAKQQNTNQLPPEIHLINNVHLPNVNNQPQPHIPNVLNQATNAYPTFTAPANNQLPPQAQPSNKPQSSPVTNNAPQSVQQPAQQQFQPIKVNQPVQLSHQVTTQATGVNQKQQQQQQQQQALIQQAIQNPQAFISQYITQQYSQQQANSNPNSNLNNNSNKLPEVNSENTSDLVDDNGSYYYGQPQVSVSSSTSTKVSHKPQSSNVQQSPSSNQSSSSSSSAVSNNQQSNSNA